LRAQRANDTTRAQRASGQPADATAHTLQHQKQADVMVAILKLYDVISFRNPTPSIDA